ncbi:MAG: ABC transporter substrate-binding protein [Dehalococcoidia bacterium]
MNKISERVLRTVWRQWRTGFLGLALVSAFWLGACGDDDADDNGAEDPTEEGTGQGSPGDGELTVAVSGEPANLDITTLYATGQGFNLLFASYEGLTKLGEAGEASPGLAESFERVGENEWEFNLRPDVTFHNGETLSADGVVAAFDRMLDPDLASEVTELLLSTVDSVEASGDGSVTFTTTQADPALPLKLVYVLIPAPELIADPDRLASEVIGTGPYQVESIQSGLEWKLRAFPDYWGEPARYADVTFLIRADDNARVATLEAGEADLALNVPAQLSETVPAYTVTPPIFIVAMSWNTNGNEWAEQKEFRQAVAYATDVETVYNFYDPTAVNARSQYAPQTLLGSNPELDAYPHDLEMARTLLDSIGYDGDEITLGVYPERFPRTELLGELLAAQLQEAGINVRILVRTLEDVVPDIVSSIGEPTEKPTIFLQAGGDADYPDPAYYLAWFGASPRSARSATQTYRRSSMQIARPRRRKTAFRMSPFPTIIRCLSVRSTCGAG